MNVNSPEKICLTKGVGSHKERLTSFELALRDAGIASYNLVYVSSIVPPNCHVLPRTEVLQLLKPGQIIFCVMSRIDTNEPNRLIAAAIGMALPHDRTVYGYLSEHKSHGQTQEKAGDYAEDLAASMLASTHGVPFDVDNSWDIKQEIWNISGMRVTTRNICQSAEGNKDGLWTTAIAAAIMI
ncbi:MAG TPA: arginine decarboxylase, pyruvoyl-dependent [Candidatus Bathyarchaeia archaeon]|nr:arginine decarboxylase, pyruvoyl-dependent [Candidatus Bathyarchaeia archaeon]